MEVPCLSFSSDDEVQEALFKAIQSKEGGYSVAINAEKIYLFQEDDSIKKIINESSFPVPDGSGAVLALKWLDKVQSIRVDLPTNVFELANKKGLKVFLLGGVEETNRKSFEVLSLKYPNAMFVGRRNGYEYDFISLVNELKLLKPDVVMLALGSPRQEVLANEMAKTLSGIFFVGCGGALDIAAGKIARAPKFFQDNHLEWFYRLINQPSRIVRQRRLPIFLYRLIKAKLFKETIK